ncbi:MAG: RloB domain-containing protein [Bacteroidia bacterium]|nr:RloB domain-containing protein [Bacteroidia bacterium]
MKMKNKRAVQIQIKKEHKESLKAKKRRLEPSLVRNEPTKFERPTILIVCEGENTEPSYFNQFKLSFATIKSVGEGHNTISLVKRAIQLSKERSFDQVWCVFDADPKPDNVKQAPNFNDAIKLANSVGFGVAYSNQAFEYWIILHLNDHQGGGMSRNDYHSKINQLLKPFDLSYDGEGSKIITEEFFELLDGIDLKTNRDRKRLAIERAERNYNLFDHKNPAKEESTTTVFKLVEELLKYI